MIRIKMIATGEILEVTPNVAHGLLESGQAVRASDKWYETREMRTSPAVPVEAGNKSRDIPRKSTQSSKTYKSK